MPFYHTKDKGKIGVITGRCSKCSYRVPWSTLFTTKLPGDVYWESKPARQGTYAKWADKYPTVAGIAGSLPRWPRWARVLSLLAFLTLVVLIIMWIRGF